MHRQTFDLQLAARQQPVTNLGLRRRQAQRAGKVQPTGLARATARVRHAGRQRHRHHHLRGVERAQVLQLQLDRRERQLHQLGGLPVQQLHRAIAELHVVQRHCPVGSGWGSGFGWGDRLGRALDPALRDPLPLRIALQLHLRTAEHELVQRDTACSQIHMGAFHQQALPAGQRAFGRTQGQVLQLQPGRAQHQGHGLLARGRAPVQHQLRGQAAGEGRFQHVVHIRSGHAQRQLTH
jgi:hypothetical protein